MAFLARHPLAIALGAIVFIMLIGSTLSIVP